MYEILNTYDIIYTRNLKAGDNMPKIAVHITLKTPEKTYTYDVPAILQDQEQTIIYQENDPDKTISKFNLSKKVLTRENNIFLMNYQFDSKHKTTGEITMKDLNKKVYLNIKTNKISRKTNNIEIDYLVEKEPYNYKIEVL